MSPAAPGGRGEREGGEEGHEETQQERRRLPRRLPGKVDTRHPSQALKLSNTEVNDTL